MKRIYKFNRLYTEHVDGFYLYSIVVINNILYEMYEYKSGTTTETDLFTSKVSYSRILIK